MSLDGYEYSTIYTSRELDFFYFYAEHMLPFLLSICLITTAGVVA